MGILKALTIYFKSPQTKGVFRGVFFNRFILGPQEHKVNQVALNFKASWHILTAIFKNLRLFKFNFNKLFLFYYKLKQRFMYFFI